MKRLTKTKFFIKQKGYIRLGNLSVPVRAYQLAIDTILLENHQPHHVGILGK